MTSAVTAARANLKIWWPELLVIAMLTAIGFAGQPDDPLFAVFCGLIGAIFWALGFRHRHLPFMQTIRRIDARLDEALARDEPEPERPHLAVVRDFPAS